MRATGAVTVCLLILVTLGLVLGFKSYEGYQVFSTKPLTSNDDLNNVAQLLRDERFNFWQEPRAGRRALIMAAPKKADELRGVLQELGLQPKLYITNVEKTFEEERAKINEIRAKEVGGLGRNVTFDRFMTLDEIDAYLDELVIMYPNLAILETIGNTYEGRPLRVLKLSTGGSGKAGIVLEGGIHAAEWLGPATALYAIDQLTAFAAENQEMLDIADWFILPVLNQDGYVWSWTEDRVWRKTRSPNNNSTCVGTDPNRNFDIHWGEGGETDPCLWNYPGRAVFSEIESKTMGDYLLARSGQLDLYMALHTYGPSLLHPWGYTADPAPSEVTLPAQEAVLAVQAVRGTPYEAGSIADLFFLAYGAAQDYAYDVAQIPLSYTWEFVEGGDTGMDPPPEEIRPACEEVWEGFKVLARHAAAQKSKMN